MNKHTEPEWFRRLRTGPYAHRTFTQEHMNRIEQVVSKAGTRTSPERKKVFIGSLALGAAIVVMITGLLTNWDRVESWMRESILQQNEQPVPAAPDDPEAERWTDPVKDETLLQVQTFPGEIIWEALPFAPEEVSRVTIRLQDGDVMDVPDAVEWFFGQLSYETSAVRQPASGSPDLLLRYHAGDKIYTVPYYAADNTLDLGGAQINGDGMIAMAAHRILQPDSPLSQFLDLQERAQALASTIEEAVFDDSYYLEEERVNIAGLELRNPAESLPLDYSLPYYYPSVPDKLWGINSYDDGRLFTWDDDVLIAGDNYRTMDGIAVGLSKAEVREILGKPNWESELEWNYYLGRGTFLLYFEGDKVKYMYYATPL